MKNVLFAVLATALLLSACNEPAPTPAGASPEATQPVDTSREDDRKLEPGEQQR